MKKVLALLFVVFLFCFSGRAEAAIALCGTPQHFFTSNATTTPLTINAPATCSAAAQNVIVFLVCHSYDTSPGCATPATFTEIAGAANAIGTLNKTQVYYHLYTSGDTIPASFTITPTGGATQAMNGFSFAYTGHNTSTPIEAAVAVASQTTPAVTTFNAPTITTTVDGDQIIQLLDSNNTGAANALGASSVATGTIQDSQTSLNLEFVYADWNQPTHQATGTNAFTWTNVVAVVGTTTIALEPAAVPTPTPTLTPTSTPTPGATPAGPYVNWRFMNKLWNIFPTN